MQDRCFSLQDVFGVHLQARGKCFLQFVALGEHQNRVMDDMFVLKSVFGEEQGLAVLVVPDYYQVQLLVAVDESKVSNIKD